MRCGVINEITCASSPAGRSNLLSAVCPPLIWPTGFPKGSKRGRKAEEDGSPRESGKAQVVRESVPLADKEVAEVGRRQPGAAESSGIEELTADPGNTGIGSQQTVCPLPTKEYHSPGTGSVDEVRSLISIFDPQNAHLDLSRNTFKQHAKRTMFHLALDTPR